MRSFDQANQLPVEEVAQKLKIWNGVVQCPGCGRFEGDGVKVINNGLKCHHGSCSDRGKAGFRNVLGLVCEVFDLEPAEALIRLEQSGFDVGSPDRFNEIGNADRLARNNREKARYVREWKEWIIYRKGRWERDVGGVRIEGLAKDEVQRLYREAGACKDEDLRKGMASWANASSTAGRIASMVKLARSVPGISVSTADLNPDPWLLNCKNGTVDLRSGGLRLHDPHDLCSRTTGIKFDPNARSELWESFLAKVTGGDKELELYLQRWAGYSATGLNTEKKFAFAYGVPNTGKSTFLDAIRSALGEYAMSADGSTWLRQTHTGGNRGDLARLQGSRLVTTSEFKEGARFDEALIKQITGGDPMTVAGKYEIEQQFTPTFKLLFAANDAPAISAGDEGMWERCQRIPFTHVLEGDPTIRMRLCDPREAGSAVLAWIVRGVPAWRERGLDPPESVLRCGEAYRTECDVVRQFLDEKCEKADGAWVSRKDLFAAFNRSSGLFETRLGEKEFTRRVRAAGVVEHKRNGDRGWRGIYLRLANGAPLDESGAGGALGGREFQKSSIESLAGTFGKRCPEVSHVPLAVLVDFETRSEADLADIGGRLYAAHATTEVVCMVAQVPGGATIEWKHGDPPPADLFVLAEQHPVVAHNANGFDRHIWESCLKWPVPSRWVDSLGLSRLAGLPGKLEAIGLLMGEEKDQEGRRHTLSLSKKDRKTGKLPELTPESIATSLRYCRQDVKILAKLWEQVAELDSFERDVRDADRAINDRGIPFDLELVDSLVRLENAHAERLRGTYDPGIFRSLKKLNAELAKFGVELPDMQAATIDRMLEGELPEGARELLWARRAMGKTTIKKLEAIKALAPDGRARDQFAYHGAHTGRWAGRGLQPQNLPRAGASDDALIEVVRSEDLAKVDAAAIERGVSVEALFSGLIRTCIPAPVGRLLAIADYSQIEARVLLWLAGDDAGLEPYRRGEDPYKVMASEAFGVPRESVSKEMRQLGKVLVLGCGYGMGWKKFKDHASRNGVNWDAIDLTAEEAVAAFRRKNALTVKLWDGLGRAAMGAIEEPKVFDAQRVRFVKRENDVCCRLPSGRVMVYREARIEEGKYGPVFTYEEPGRGRREAWGGKLAENLSQAVARDIQASALVRCEAEPGIDVVLHVHDEIVAEIADDAKARRLAEIMRTPPEWADGLPIGVETFLDRRYRK